jgi:hypothetical protein
MANVELRDGPIRGNVYAQKGEGSFCANGHLLGVFVEPVEYGEISEGKLWPVGAATIGMIACPSCGVGMTGNAHFFEAAN